MSSLQVTSMANNFEPVLPRKKFNHTIEPLDFRLWLVVMCRVDMFCIFEAKKTNLAFLKIGWLQHFL